jgi:hypothetical protein
MIDLLYRQDHGNNLNNRVIKAKTLAIMMNPVHWSNRPVMIQLDEDLQWPRVSAVACPLKRRYYTSGQLRRRGETYNAQPSGKLNNPLVRIKFKYLLLKFPRWSHPGCATSESVHLWLPPESGQPRKG